MPRTLLVIIPDDLSAIIKKGETPPRYYNPGDLFDEVHILMTNEDAVDPAAVQPMVGRARVFIHNQPKDGRILGSRSRFFQQRYLRKWCDRGVALARRIQPDLIRCHGVGFNTILARAIKRHLGVPYVISLHTNPDLNPQNRPLHGNLSDAEWCRLNFWERHERLTLTAADMVIPVYQSIVPYVIRMGVKRWQVIYNVLDAASLVRKASYDLGVPVRIVFTGRQFDRKDPSNILRAVAGIENVELTLIGYGPINSDLRALALDLGIAGRVRFIPSMPNDELCRSLGGYDVFTANIHTWGISKSVLEAMLAGLPVVINKPALPTPEVEGDHILVVPDTEQGYREAIDRLLGESSLRQASGTRAREYAVETFEPEITESRYTGAYKSLLENREAGPLRNDS